MPCPNRQRCQASLCPPLCWSTPQWSQVDCNCPFCAPAGPDDEGSPCRDSRDCSGDLACRGDAGFCVAACSGASDCGPGRTCAGSQCTPRPSFRACAGAVARFEPATGLCAIAWSDGGVAAFTDGGCALPLDGAVAASVIGTVVTNGSESSVHLTLGFGAGSGVPAKVELNASRLPECP